MQYRRPMIADGRSVAVSSVRGAEREAADLRRRLQRRGLRLLDASDEGATVEVRVDLPERGLRARLRGGAWCGVDLTASRVGADPLRRAVKPPHVDGTWHVVDATGGFGGDAASIAAAGANVTIVERDPLIFVLLEDALERARRDRAQAALAGRMRCLEGDARHLLATIDATVDVVYLDPMYASAKGGAKRAPMELLRRWLDRRVDGSGEDETATSTGADELSESIEVARRVATRRVVVKRALKAAPLAGRSGSIDGRTTRFDLFAPRR